MPHRQVIPGDQAWRPSFLLGWQAEAVRGRGRLSGETRAAAAFQLRADMGLRRSRRARRAFHYLRQAMAEKASAAASGDEYL